MRIKAVSECTGLSDRTIRYYIEEKLITPEYTENYAGRRSFEFSPEDVEALKQISVLRSFGFSVEEIRTIIQDPGATTKVISDVMERTNATLSHSHDDLTVLRRMRSDRPYTLAELAATLRKQTATYEKTEHTPIYEDVVPIVRGDILFCPVCSQHNIPPTATHCPNCNTKFVQKNWICPKCEHGNYYATAHCCQCNAPYSHANAGQSYYLDSKQGKKWFHYLIYFALFAIGIVNILTGVIVLYDAPLSGLLSIGIGAVYLFVRYALAHFKHYGPSLYLWTRAITILLSLVQTWMENVQYDIEMRKLLASNYPSKAEVFDSVYVDATAEIIVMGAVFIVIFVCECVYFSKRSEWFNQK